MSVTEKIRYIVSKTLEIELDSINDKTNIDNTPNWDSLKHLELILSLEDEFGIEVEAEHVIIMVDFRTIVDTVNFYLDET